MPKIYEYRGVEGLVCAELLTDDKNGITWGEPFDIAGVAQITKATDSSNEAHYYDNVAAIVVSNTGSDTITINASAIPNDVLAKITGQFYDATTGMYVEQVRTPKYFAIGYKTKDTNGDVYYVWRLKGSFNVPDQTSITEDDSTDANGQEIIYTGVSTVHKFSKTNESAKGVTVNTGLGLIDVSEFFDTVQTPDTIAPQEIVVPTAITVAPASATLDIGDVASLAVALAPSNTTNKSVTWESSDTAVATVDEFGNVTAKAAGTATITATSVADETLSDDCSITVNSAP